MNLNSIIPIAISVALAGCVTSTPEELFAVPETQHPGKVKDTGQFPAIGVDPVISTPQMTAEEEAKLRADLARQGERAKQQADANAQSNYKGDAEALRRLAQQRQEQLKSQIEADQPTQ